MKKHAKTKIIGKLKTDLKIKFIFINVNYNIQITKCIVVPNTYLILKTQTTSYIPIKYMSRLMLL